MTNEKGKSSPPTGKTSSAGYQAEQSADTAQLVDLLTNVLKSVQMQVETQPRPALEGKPKQAVDEYIKIAEELRVPTQLKPEIDEPKWKSPPLNPRARVKDER